MTRKRKRSEMHVRKLAPYPRNQGSANTAQQRYKLRDLLRGMTPKAMHEAYDWGPERGREIVDA